AYMAVEQGLEIIPVINKIDLPSSRPDYVIREIEDVVGLDCDHVILASAKEGKGIDDILERVVEKVPAPLGDREAPLQAMIFDSVYDNYKGVICYIRVVNGRIRAGQTIRFMATGGVFPVEEVGVFRPGFQPCDELAAGEVGYVVSNIKTVAEAHTGDTITDNGRPAASPLPGYRKVKPVVFCGFYPVERDDYPQLRDALEKLTLNDSSINFEPETSVALGFGFRCGFLGLLHMDVSKERLRREFGVELVATAPNVVYEVVTKDGGLIEAHRPSDFPEIGEIQEVREPVIKISLFVPTEYVGKVMKLCQDKRGTYISMDYLAPDRVRLMYELPLAEFIIDFHDKLKSQTRGYASLDYEFTGLKAADLVRVDVLVSGEAADAFSFICHRDSAYHRGQAAVRKLKELIPSQLFEVPIQASVGKKVIVRQNVKALRKDVLAKCYGGDITRKRKLLEKQKEGKKRMKQIGKVSIPQEAFLAFLQVEEDEEK
ncbi:MAG TPA: translation elongation factor 4, partial [Aminivibrio sp.]|nr:translation elongation factor 4 [Aminivibrio sp.]